MFSTWLMRNVTGVKNSLWQHFPQYVTANLWTNFSLHRALGPDTSSYTIHNSRATKFPANKISQLNFARESILLQLRENLQVQKSKSDENHAKLKSFSRVTITALKINQEDFKNIPNWYLTLSLLLKQDQQKYVNWT